MAEGGVVVVQKETSPYGDLLKQALADGAQGPLWRADPALLPLRDRSPGAMLLWDLTGFSLDEAREIAIELASEEIGLVLLCSGDEKLCRLMISLCRPNALLWAPGSPAEVTAALEVGRLNHRRIAQGGARVAQAQQQLDERLLVEEAKRVLMKARGLSEPQAMRALQKHSRNTNQRLAEVARRLLQAAPLLDGKEQED